MQQTRNKTNLNRKNKKFIGTSSTKIFVWVFDLFS